MSSYRSIRRRCCCPPPVSMSLTFATAPLLELEPPRGGYRGAAPPRHGRGDDRAGRRGVAPPVREEDPGRRGEHADADRRAEQDVGARLPAATVLVLGTRLVLAPARLAHDVDARVVLRVDGAP